MKYKLVIGCVAIVAALLLNLTLTVGNENVTVTSGTMAYAVAAPPLMDEYTHPCTWAGLKTVAIEAQINANGGLAGVTIKGDMIYASGTEVSCEMAWANCSRWGSCVANFAAGVY